jgi:hypothetical protein
MTRKLLVYAIAVAASEVVGALAVHFLPWFLAFPAIAIAGYYIVDNAEQQAK